MSKRQLTLPCDCVGACGCVLITDWEAYGESPAEFTIDFYQHIGYQDRLWGRLKTALAVLRKRHPYTHGIVLYAEKAGELQEFLSESAASEQERQS